MSQPWPDAQDPVRADIARVGASLFQRGLVHSTAGNISVRLSAEQGGGYLITPTDACLGFLEPAQLAWVGEDGTALAGARASKTLTLHRRIYAAAPGAHCVLHTHSTHLVALTLQGVWRPDDILPPLTPYQLMKVGHVPLAPYRVPGDAGVADDVAALIANAQRPLHAVMLERLGPTVWHDSPGSAMALLEELEETARLWLLTDRRPAALNESQVTELQARFNTLW
ncbi:ribulose-5-phosphate 4-epimerase/fuculose-1-phosphate aldolase [Hydrogenophaga palleronii]|uniref:Ribulose-5-phosphate 4-epimerase/fuculose-1-phosphate aldolase n=1 Tax=Hydrogenophaga palleronii TaxID=65655 RepID=A0ABU1WMI3_9BURK|nr:aldolase [Hydrogenophaga palleronii]MDR7150483.1 ribulose-5-phosphate 4-epimerase/fuculose-1-phosphate aldolase [Hydrogenophaga palleronii]